MWYVTSSLVFDVDGSLLSEFISFSDVPLLSVEESVSSQSIFPLVCFLGRPTLAAGGAVIALPFCPLVAGETFSMTPSNQAPILTSLQSTNSFIWTDHRKTNQYTNHFIQFIKQTDLKIHLYQFRFMHHVLCYQIKLHFRICLRMKVLNDFKWTLK